MALQSMLTSSADRYLEAADGSYTWINQTVFVAQSRVFPASPNLLGFEHQVYQPS